MMRMALSLALGGALLSNPSDGKALATDCGTAAAVRPVRLWDGFRSPVGMAFDARGHLLVAEWGAGQVTRIAPDGRRTILAQGLAGPSGLTVGLDETVYVATYSGDEILRFTPAAGSDTGRMPVVHARGLATPAGLSFDRTGRLMVANRRTHQVLAVAADGTLKPVISGLNTPVGAVQTPDGGYVVSNIGGGVTIVKPDGTRIEAGQSFKTPGPGVAMSRDGRVYVVDYGGTTVREVFGDGHSCAVADGLRSPVGLVFDPDGQSLLVATWGDGTIYRINLRP